MPRPSTPIFWAAWYRDIERMARVLDEDPSSMSEVWRGYTPLTFAARLGPVEMVNLLLSRGADIHGEGECGKTALMEASAKGHVNIVLLLLRHLDGRGLDEVDDYGDTALALACDGGWVEVVRVLLLAGADDTIANNDGQTPRQIAEVYSEVTEVSDTYSFMACR